MDSTGSPSDDAGATRRAALRMGAVTAVGGLAGCMQPLLEEGTGEAGGNESTAESTDGSADEFENALELEPAWDVDIVGSSVVTVDGTFFTQVGDRQLTELDSEGDVLWQADPIDVEDYSFSLPTVTGAGDGLVLPDEGDGTVYCLANSHDDGPPRLYAYDSDTGSSRWTLEPEGIDDVGVLAGTDDGIVYNGYDGEAEELRAVDAAGEQRWSTALGDDVDGPSGAPKLEYAEGYVYAYDISEFGIYDVTDGSLVEAFEWTTAVMSFPAAWVDDTLFALTDGGNELTAYDLPSLEVEWQEPLERSGNSTPAVDSGEIYVGVEGGYVHAHDAETGSPLWESPRLEGSIGVEPVVGGHVWVTDDVGTIYGLEREGGELQYREVYGDDTEVSMAATDDVLLVGNSGQAYRVEST